MKDNGVAILQTYAMPDGLIIFYGGFAQLATMTVNNVYKIEAEDKEILKDIGWTQVEPHAWKIEWWD